MSEHSGKQARCTVEDIERRIRALRNNIEVQTAYGDPETVTRLLGEISDLEARKHEAKHGAM